jgi:hypothetical protein
MRLETTSNPVKVVSATLVGSALKQAEDGECQPGVHGTRENVRGSTPPSSAISRARDSR